WSYLPPIVRWRRAAGSRAGDELDSVRDAQRRLGASGRRPDRGDARRRHHRLQPRPFLQLGLYGGGPGPAALLRLFVAVQLRDAAACERRHPRSDVLRLGGGWPRLVPADRFLVPQAVG